MKLNAKQLRSNKYSVRSTQTNKNEIYFILDNVLDTYNIGSIFRLADAVSAKKVFLCGQTEIPPNHKIKKASINTTEVVKWVYSDSTKEVINTLRSEVHNIQIIAVEQANGTIPYTKFEYKMPLALIVGNETTGIAKEVMDICDGIVELPMFGVNISLNVMVSLAVVVYYVLEVCLDL